MIYMIYIIYTFSQYKSSKKPHSLSANHLITVVLLCQDTQTGLNHTSTQTQHQMEGGLYRQSTFPRSDIFNNWVQYTLWDKGVIRDKPSLTVVLENTAVRSQLHSLHVKLLTFLDIVVRQSASIFQLFASKDKTLLVWRDTYKRWTMWVLCIHYLMCNINICK